MINLAIFVFHHLLYGSSSKVVVPEDVDEAEVDVDGPEVDDEVMKVVVVLAGVFVVVPQAPQVS